MNRGGQSDFWNDHASAEPRRVGCRSSTHALEEPARRRQGVLRATPIGTLGTLWLQTPVPSLIQQVRGLFCSK